MSSVPSLETRAARQRDLPAARLHRTVESRGTRQPDIARSRTVQVGSDPRAGAGGDRAGSGAHRSRKAARSGERQLQVGGLDVGFDRTARGGEEHRRMPSDRGFADDLRRCRGAKRLEPLRSGYDGRDRTVADRLGVDRDAQVAVPSFDRHVVDHVVVGRDENVRCGRIDRDPDSPRDVQGVVVARPAALLRFHPAAAFQRPGPSPAVAGFRRGVSCSSVSCRDVSCRRMFRRGGSVFRSGGFRRGAEGSFRLRGGPGEEAEQGEQSFFHIGCILGFRSVRRRPEGRRIPLRGYAAVASAGPDPVRRTISKIRNLNPNRKFFRENSAADF